MIGRRQLLGGGLTGGVLGAVAGPEAQRPSDVDLAPVVRAVNELRDELRIERRFTEIAGLREAQIMFLRQNGKLPDFIDVGADVWFAAHDWHIRWQQPLTVTRDPSGRLLLLLLSTQLVLRHESERTYMSLPYDNR